MNKNTYFILLGVMLLIGAGCSTTNEQTSVNADTNQQVSVEATESTSEASEEETIDPYEGWETYTNDEYGFSFRYASDLNVDVATDQKYLDSVNQIVSVTVRDSDNTYDRGLTFSIIDENYNELVSLIEESDLNDAGESLSSVFEESDVTVSDRSSKKAMHNTAIGIPVIFYHIPLDNEHSLLIHTDDSESYSSVISSVSFDQLALSSFESDYGYTVRYDSKYQNNDAYSIWNEQYENSDYVEEWGINVAQNTLVVIRTYENDKRSSFNTTNETININGKEAYSITINDFWDGYLVEAGDYFLTIYTTLSESDSGYGEYESIVSSIQLQNERKDNLVLNENLESYTKYGYTVTYPKDTILFSQCESLDTCNTIQRKEMEEFNTSVPFQRFTYESVVNDKKYINSLSGDDLYELPSGIKVRRQIQMEEGGGIVQRYYWYDDIYQYSIHWVFPVSAEIETEFRLKYSTSDARNQFIDDINNGNQNEYQYLFTEFDEIVQTLR